MKLGRALLVCVALVATPQARQAAGSARDIVVHGRVVAADTHTPLRNARVAFVGSGAKPVATDAQGQFAVAGPLHGRLIASKPGFSETTSAAVDGGDVELARGAVITGRVLDDLGSPLPLITVVAQRLVIENGRSHAVTYAHAESDDTGSYRIFDLPAGEFVVATGAPRILTGTVTPVPRPMENQRLHDFYPHAESAGTASVLRLGVGQELDGIDLTIALPHRPSTAEPTTRRPSGSIVRGRVTEADGRPVRAARIELASPTRRVATRETVTSDDGDYEFEGVAAGEYLVAATTLRFERVAYRQRRPGDRGDDVIVDQNTTVEHVDITIPRPGIVAGRIVDEYGDAIAHVNVRTEQLRWRNGRMRLVRVAGVAGQQTNDRGEFRIAGLPPGRFVVSAIVGEEVPGWETNDLPGYQQTYYAGTPNAGEAELIEIAPGRDALNVQFALLRGATGRIAGRALTASGAPLHGTLYLMPSNRSNAIVTTAFPMRALTSTDGEFAFERLPPGEYVVQAATSGSDRATEGEFAAQWFMVAGSAVDAVVVRMSLGSALSGRVTFEGDPPDSPEGFEVSTLVADPDFASLADNPAARAEPSDDWRFTMRGVNGARRLAVRAPGDWLMKAVLVNGIDVTDTPLRFGRADDSLDNVEIVMTRQATMLRASVVADADAPARGALVMMFSTDRSRWVPGARFAGGAPVVDGVATIRGLPPGEYFVVGLDPRADDGQGELAAPDYLETLAARAVRVTLAFGGTATTTVRLPR